MNSITINGVSSDTITGLIIQELPPITKPPIRNQIEEIDGRDGDIVTKLGYGAYDKVISIGLSFNYDINQIISFFNSEGTIIFSNEPTKYYKFQILEQIDFEKLIRFKTASVIMHVQPFKYLLNEAPIVFNPNIISGEGTSFILNGTKANKPFNDLKFKGNFNQNTTTGRNVIDTNNFETITQKGVTISKNDDGTFNIVGTATSTGSFPISNDFSSRLKNGSTYAEFLSEEYGNQLNIYCQLGYANSSINLTPTAYKTINTTQYGTLNTAYLRLYVTSGNVYDYHNLKFMIGEGTTLTADDYEPFTDGVSPNPLYPQEVKVVTGNNTITISNSDNTKSQSFNINLGSIELCKTGTYQDHIYKSGDKWYKHEVIEKIILNGTQGSWAKGSASGEVYSVFQATSWGLNKYLRNTTEILSNRIMGGNNTSTLNGEYIQTGAQTNSPLRISILNSRLSEATSNGFNTFLTSNNFTCYIPLATPNDIEITDTTLINQLEEIQKARTYESKTSLSSNGNVLPTIYAEILNSYLIVNNIGNINAKPKIKIFGEGTCGIYLNNLQIFSINFDNTGNDYLTIDCEKMEAYKDNLETLRNRDVKGDYSKFILNIGENAIDFSGNISEIVIENYNRWL